MNTSPPPTRDLPTKTTLTNIGNDEKKQEKKVMGWCLMAFYLTIVNHHPTKMMLELVMMRAKKIWQQPFAKLK
jgi:hypothetical protein